MLGDVCFRPLRTSNITGIFPVSGGKAMFIPIWILVLIGVLAVLFAIWATATINGRNPLPFPDRGSRIFAASSVEAKDALVELLGRHGMRERFRMDSSGIRRSIMWDGTIINHSPDEVRRKLNGATSCIGLVSEDPETDARAAAQFLYARGFDADVVTDAEPNLPIAFVVTRSLARPSTSENTSRRCLGPSSRMSG